MFKNYSSIAQIKHIIKEYEDLLGSVYDIKNHLWPLVQCSICDFEISDNWISLIVTDGYDSWSYRFPAKYFTMDHHIYMEDWEEHLHYIN